MQTNESQQYEPAVGELAEGLSLHVAADLQDHLLTATNDLERLQRLLSDASQSLMGHFYGANEQLASLVQTDAALLASGAHVLEEARRTLAGAVTALQFQDMASQLIVHTNQRLRSCADLLAREAMGQDSDGDAVVEQAPLRPNPVTQDEMDAGSVDLF